MTNRSPRLRRTLVLTAAPLAAAALLLGGAGTAQAAVRPTAELSRNPPPAAASFSKGAASISFTIHNDTDQTLTLDPTNTLHTGDGAHWAQRAQATLGPKASEVVTAYTNGIQGVDVQVTYRLPNGEYACAFASVPAIGDNTIRDGIGTGWDTDNTWYQVADPAYQTNVGSIGSKYHPSADVTIGTPA